MRRVILDYNLQVTFRMTLGHVYDMDLRRNESTIKEVIIQAQGEVRLNHSSPNRPLIVIIACCVDGPRRVYPTGERDLDQLHAGFGQLPEQVSTDSVS